MRVDTYAMHRIRRDFYGSICYLFVCRASDLRPYRARTFERCFPILSIILHARHCRTYCGRDVDTLAMHRSVANMAAAVSFTWYVIERAISGFTRFLWLAVNVVFNVVDTF